MSNEEIQYRLLGVVIEMKKLKVKYLDWWAGFDSDNYMINEILRNHYDIIETNNPDYVICSMYSKEALKYDCVRIFYSGENFCPDFNLFDYAIGFERMDYGDRYVYGPNYILNPKYWDDVKKMLVKHTREAIDEKNKTDFCSFVVSNGVGDSLRLEFFEELSKYKKVNSGGRYQNNIGQLDGVPDKYEFQKCHKFSICFENSSHPGYITEKIVQGFAAGTIPIYWGAQDVSKFFNENAMVVVRDRSDVYRAVEQIKKIDNDDGLYRFMLEQPAIMNIDYIENLKKDLENFLVNIFEQPIEKAYRRPNEPMVKAYYEEKKSERKRMDFVNAFRHIIS